jgi:kelch-like protein 10
MSLILEYSYVRFVDISQENVWQLLVSADSLSVLDALELCCDFLRSTFGLDKSIGIMRFARQNFCSSLESDSRCFVMRKFVQIIEQSDELSELSPEELHVMIGADELNVKSEEVVWECLLQWLNHGTQNRGAL